MTDPAEAAQQTTQAAQHAQGIAEGVLRDSPTFLFPLETRKHA